jgi:hypothetical protein
MDTLKTFTKLLGVSTVLSYLILFLPQSNGITIGIFFNRQTQTNEFVREVYASGFPLKFYIPAGSDYGGNFMTEGFVTNTIVVFIAIFLIHICYKKLTQN